MKKHDFWGLHTQKITSVFGTDPPTYPNMSHNQPELRLRHCWHIFWNSNDRDIVRFLTLAAQVTYLRHRCDLSESFLWLSVELNDLIQWRVKIKDKVKRWPLYSVLLSRRMTQGREADVFLLSALWCLNELSTVEGWSCFGNSVMLKDAHTEQGYAWLLFWLLNDPDHTPCEHSDIKVYVCFTYTLLSSSHICSYGSRTAPALRNETFASRWWGHGGFSDSRGS